MNFPSHPYNGQEFIDSQAVQWEYDLDENVWIKIGPVSDIPLARSEDDTGGATNGLFSAKYKLFIDSLSNKPGGFGFIFKQGVYITEDGPDAVLSGDVELKSYSLDIICEDISSADGCLKTVVKFDLSDDFLDTFCVEVRGRKGQKGHRGVKGKPGRPGTGDGPQGKAGADGKTATTQNAFSGIKIVESDNTYDTAVVDLILRAQDGVLDVVKSKIAVPSNDAPALKVNALPIFRDIEFTGVTLSEWQLVAPANDPAGETDITVIRLPTGWSGGVEGAVPVIPIKLSDTMQLIIDQFQTRADEISAAWDKDIDAFIVQKDEAARSILAELAQELAECEWQKPVTFCLGLQPCQ